MTAHRLSLVSLLLIAASLTACQDEKTAMSSDIDPRQIALEFTRALAARDYARAHAMTTRDYAGRTSVDRLAANFETIVPPDWGPTEPIELGETMTDWPGKLSADLGWFYVSIYGDVYSEAVVVVVSLEDGIPKIRQVELGRP